MWPGRGRLSGGVATTSGGLHLEEEIERKRVNIVKITEPHTCKIINMITSVKQRKNKEKRNRHVVKELNDASTTQTNVLLLHVSSHSLSLELPCNVIQPSLSIIF